MIGFWDRIIEAAKAPQIRLAQVGVLATRYIKHRCSKKGIFLLF
jgi:hypothetical protein